MNMYINNSDWTSQTGPHEMFLRTLVPEYQRGVLLCLIHSSLTFRGFCTCFILASSLRVCSSFLRSFLFPTRMMGTLGQKCFTSGVHFSGIFSVPGETRSELKHLWEEGVTIKRDRQCRVTVQNTSHDGLLCRLLEAKIFFSCTNSTSASSLLYMCFYYLIILVTFLCCCRPS